jgi:hypothetical protein
MPASSQNNDSPAGPATGTTPGGTGAADHDFKTFEEFWPYYVAMHSQPATRMVHALGTLAAGALAVTGLLRLRPKPKRVLMAPIVGYGAAWAAHFLIERNNPATFGYPAWSLQGDVEILKMMLQGRDSELTEIARDWLAENPEDRSPGSIEPA